MIVSPVRPLIYIYIYIYTCVCVIRKILVVGFSPHAYDAGVFAKKCAWSLFIQCLGPARR